MVIFRSYVSLPECKFPQIIIHVHFLFSLTKTIQLWRHPHSSVLQILTEVPKDMSTWPSRDELLEHFHKASGAIF